MASPRRTPDLLLAIAACLYGATAVIAQRSDAFTASRDHAAIQYSTAAVDTSVTRLNRDLDAGRATLTADGDSGYLRALLTALAIPIESQLLVFSETSAQARLITPRTPRAVYFNDSTAVGWVPAATEIEIAAHDLRQGTVFYTLDQKPGERPRLTRKDGCLQCHLSWDTLGVPGWTMISTFPMPDDKNAYASGVTVDHRTSIESRFGGWYVTGRSVPVFHFGNQPVIRPAAEIAALGGSVPRAPVLATLAGRLGAPGYLSPQSDVAAAMVLSHQAHMLNQLTRLGWEGRVAALDRSSSAPNPRMPQAVRDFVDYLLFVDEAPLPRRIEGATAFAEKFNAIGPHDSRGRSLRQLDLERRLLRYRCSYLVYAPAFDALPAPVLDAVYRRMWAILSGQETGGAYAGLSRADRTAIVEILRETKRGLPGYFQAVTR